MYPVVDSIVVKRVYRNFPIMFPNRFSHIDLVEHYMYDFDVILGMDWLHACFGFIDCRARVAKINFPNEPIFEWKRVILFLEVISFLN